MPETSSRPIRRCAHEIEKGIRNKANVLAEELLGTPEPDANEGDESL